MNVTVESLAPCKKLMRVEVEAQRVDEAFESITKDFQKQAALPGFRPGKVPLKMVAQQYGQQVRSDVISDAVSESFNDAVREQNLRVAGYPRIERRDDGAASQEALEF